ncbi:hypothetical protein LCGC14_1101610 [marine sediment metagenome]|uniref:Uncharacterized protein n=1 Tax=marine sediment metagenome TaxID=412755 RepID=A0A0F9MDU1_9ZZZZ
MSDYYNMVITIRAEDQEEAEQVVERGVDKQGYAVLDVAASRIKDEDIIKELDAQDVAF